MKKVPFLLLIIGIIFLFSGCSHNYVSDQTILQDLQENDLFAVHMTEIEEYNIIKRLSSEEQDSVYINVKGKNAVYQISLNYKMVYLPYNDGWLIETVEQYEDTNEYINEILPLQGPTQDNLDYFTGTVEWDTYSSYGKEYTKELTWDIRETGLLELDNDYGKASYQCTITYEYDFFEETVSFPVYFNFAEIASDGTRGWYAYKEDSVESIERKVSLTDEVCGDWYCEYSFTPAFSVKKLTYNVDFTISSIEATKFSNEENENKYCVVDNYTYSGDETFETNGTMQLVPYFNKDDGKISSLILKWSDGNAHPNQCASLSFSNMYYYKNNPYSFTLVSSYKPSYGLSDYSLVLRKK